MNNDTHQLAHQFSSLLFLDDGQLTCNRAQGTSACLGLLPGSVAAGTPRSARAGCCRPGWHERRAAPGPRGTVGRRCQRGSQRSRCAGTGAGSQHMRGAGTRKGVGSDHGVGSAGTEDTPSGLEAAGVNEKKTKK